MSCHHIWESIKTEEFTENGVAMKRYTHKCFHCPRVKVTVKAVRALPPEAKWKREMEKLLERADRAGIEFCYNSMLFDLTKVTVIEK